MRRILHIRKDSVELKMLKRLGIVTVSAQVSRSSLLLCCSCYFGSHLHTRNLVCRQSDSSSWSLPVPSRQSSPLWNVYPNSCAPKSSTGSTLRIDKNLFSMGDGVLSTKGQSSRGHDCALNLREPMTTFIDAIFTLPRRCLGQTVSQTRFESFRGGCVMCTRSGSVISPCVWFTLICSILNLSRWRWCLMAPYRCSADLTDVWHRWHRYIYGA